MKIREDFITNSSSSSYLICTNKTIEEFLQKDLSSIVNYRDINELMYLKELLREGIKDLKNNRRRAFIICYHSIYNREECKEELKKTFNKFSEGTRFYLTEEFDGRRGHLVDDLDWDRTFNYKRIKEISGLEIFYMNHH